MVLRFLNRWTWEAVAPLSGATFLSIISRLFNKNRVNDKKLKNKVSTDPGGDITSARGGKIDTWAKVESFFISFQRNLILNLRVFRNLTGFS